MEVFGLSIGEIITLLASAVALILTVMRAGKKDVTTESVEHLLEPLNTQNQRLQEQIERQQADFEAYKKRNTAWKVKVSKKLVAVASDLQSLSKEADRDDT